MCVYDVCMCFKSKYVHVGQRSTSDVVPHHPSCLRPESSLLCMPGWLTRELPGILLPLLTSHRRLAGIIKYATTLDFMWVLRFELRTTQLHTANAFSYWGTPEFYQGMWLCAWRLCCWVCRYHGLLSAEQTWVSVHDDSCLFKVRISQGNEASVVCSKASLSCLLSVPPPVLAFFHPHLSSPRLSPSVPFHSWTNGCSQIPGAGMFSSCFAFIYFCFCLVFRIKPSALWVLNMVSTTELGNSPASCIFMQLDNYVLKIRM